MMDGLMREFLAAMLEGKGAPNQPVAFEGGVGLSIDDAVCIRNASTTIVGIMAEDGYISRRHGAIGKQWKKLFQSLQSGPADHPCDAITIRLLDSGEELTYYFDISDFFGT